MYSYSDNDRTLVRERVAQFRDQTRRYLAGELSEDQFKPLRLMNGLYIQRHAPMLRVAIPYGLLSSTQLRVLAEIARDYDRGYGHFTTRQNIQFNWPELASVPDILARLADVDMHAIQTSGNCIRNTTTDHLAGVAADEIEDPRPYCEIIRQWSTLHPEFSFLPRKFKIAVTGSAADRAATQVHDIGLHLVRNDDGAVGFEVLVGGGLGRTPVIGKVLRDFLPKRHLLSYLEAILRVYNLMGRRDNLYKARIKILVNSLGIDEFRNRVDDEWRSLRDDALTLEAAEIARMRGYFTDDDGDADRDDDGDNGDDGDDAAALAERLRDDAAFSRWYWQNTREHKTAGLRIVFVSLKEHGVAPGDIDADQMDALAGLADRYSRGQLRVVHDQNLVLADVRQGRLYTLWQALSGLRLATPNIGTATDLICCPGLDFCSLANAGSLPIAAQIQQRFDDLDALHKLGPVRINISGCINACGHHHVGHIGILGVDKNGEEWYQITLGGSSGSEARLGKRLGPAVAKKDVADVVERLLDTYLERRDGDRETFADAVQRLGLTPFKERVYESAA